jgi:hypothetical protein
MADTVVLPRFEQFAGLGLGAQNLVAGILQRQQQQRTAQQLQGLGLPGGLTAPFAQQFAAQQSLGQQDIAGRMAVAGAGPVTRPQLQAQRILELQAKERAGTITEPERASLKTLLEGRAQVQVTIGEKDIRRDTLQQRSEFAKDSRVKDIRIIEKFTRNVETAYNRSLVTGKNLGPIDITLAKSFQKLTDLGSTVREGEFATTFEGQRLINKWRGKLQQIIKGGLGFTPEDRKELRDLVLALEQDSRKLFNQAFDEFSITADELGLNKRAIFGGAKKFDVTRQQQQQFQVGQTVINNGQPFTITGFDADGTPRGDPVR